MDCYIGSCPSDIVVIGASAGGMEALQQLFAGVPATIRASPECHGVLSRMDEGSIQRFRCHTGHAFAAHSLLHALGEQIESRLWDTVRAVDESVMLLNHLGKHLQQLGDSDAAKDYFRKAQEALERAEPLRQAAQAEG